MARTSVHKLKEWKAEGRKFAMITAYDYPSARLVEQAGIQIILVGDSLGSVILGYDSTVPVTMDDIVYHTRAVVRATQKAIIVADMPFMSYQANADEAVRNAGRLLGVAARRRLEGGSHGRRYPADGQSASRSWAPTPRPEPVGGYCRQDCGGREAERRARAEEAALCGGVETIPAPRENGDRAATIPTIGIAGAACDAQVQVFTIPRIYDDQRPLRHVRYAVSGDHPQGCRRVRRRS
jgi:3-methyl-2-oxobutanoate hydroxymethyltransferase